MLVLPLLLACQPVDPDATGARWDTGTDPRPTTTQTDTLVVLDTDTTVSTTDTGRDPRLCLGEGEPRAQLGRGGLAGFVPYGDGDAVELVHGPSDALGIYLDLLSEGLDTSDDINVILRMGMRRYSGGNRINEDYLAVVRMQCPQPGPGWVRVFAALPDQLQEAADEGLAFVPEVELGLSLIDAHGEQDTVYVDLDLEL